MDLNSIDKLIVKYLDGATSIAEENELKNYFSSPNVAQHLEHYAPLFTYYSKSKLEGFELKLPLKHKRKPKNYSMVWMSIAATLVLMFGLYQMYEPNPKLNTEFGSFENPKIAFEATQKALALLSENVNTGIKSTQYLGEFEVTRNKVFVVK